MASANISDKNAAPSRSTLGFIVTGAAVLVWAIVLLTGTLSRNAQSYKAPPEPRSIVLPRSAGCGRTEQDGMLLYTAIENSDRDGVSGLLLRGKALTLAAGTRLDELSAAEHGLRAVFIASGTYIGESCWIPQVVLE